MALDRLKIVESLLPSGAAEAVHALALPPAYAGAPRVLLHGDLYLRHLLFDDAGAWTAVIDWGDLCLGDPAVDLAIGYTALPPEARTAFFDAYGTVDESTRGRARLIGLARHAITLLAYATDRQDGPLAAEALLAVRHALAL